MSALARYFHNMGYAVYGYDKTPSPLTLSLEQEGIAVGYRDDTLEIPKEVLGDKGAVLIVYTPAIPADNVMLNYFRTEQYDLKKRAEVLGIVTAQTTNLSVAGTHGKTTTSCIVATILQHSEAQFSAFLGGISTNLKSNYYYQEGEGAHLSITEADEFDRSFLHLQPNYAVVTSTDADHLDIYGKKEELEQSYKDFSDLVGDKRNVYSAYGNQTLNSDTTYSGSDSRADFYAVVSRKDGKGTHFEIANTRGDEVLKNLYLNIPGSHNLENAVGATLMCLKAGISLESIRSGLANFKGIKRRFEYILETEEVVYIDDYAHHPSELRAIISSVKELYPSRKITAVFQPHLYSRTQDFMSDFASELSKVDELLLLPIYPARELPIRGVTSEALLEQISLTSALVLPSEDVVAELKKRDVEVVLTLGAGDIDRLVGPIKECFDDC